MHYANINTSVCWVSSLVALFMSKGAVRNLTQYCNVKPTFFALVWLISWTVDFIKVDFIKVNFVGVDLVKVDLAAAPKDRGCIVQG